MAQNLFFSGRSFQTRTDLLHSALETAQFTDEWREFLVEGLKKASGYNGTRNRLAHGLMHPNALDESGHPKDWKIKEPAEWQSPAGFDYGEIAP